MGWMPDVRGLGRLCGQPADRKDPASGGQFLQERPGGGDLAAGWPPVRPGRARMGRDDVPAERVEPELRERPLDDRRAGFSRAAAAELPLRREGDAGDAGTAVAGRLSDEQQSRRPSRLEVGAETPAPELGAVTVPVEVVGRTDLRGREPADEPFSLHGVTMLMRVRGRIAAVAAACAGVCATNAYAAPPQGFQSDAAFAGSYGTRSVSSVAATTQRVSCYTPEVLYNGSLGPSQGYPDGGSTPCAGAATTGELLGPFPAQNASNPPLRVKDFSESDLHVDPTNPRHLIGVSKWFVNVEGYNHLTGFYESYDGGATWPQQGHIPGYEGWTDNSDPVGAFDPWGNFYAVVFPYQFSYVPSGQHFFLSPDVNPSLPRSGLGIAVRPHGAATATAWNTTQGGQLDLIERTPFNGSETFDKQWLAINTNRRSRHFGRVYVTWAIGNQDRDLRIYGSYADARANGTHTNWSRPRLVRAQALGVGDNGSLPRVAPDGTVWLATASFRT